MRGSPDWPLGQLGRPAQQQRPHWEDNCALLLHWQTQEGIGVPTNKNKSVLSHFLRTSVKNAYRRQMVIVCATLWGQTIRNIMQFKLLPFWLKEQLENCLNFWSVGNIFILTELTVPFVKRPYGPVHPKVWQISITVMIWNTPKLVSICMYSPLQ